MSFFSSNLCPKRFLLSSMLIGILSLGACQKADIITQPAAPNTTSAVAQPTFNAESFSTNGLTLSANTIETLDALVKQRLSNAK